jgi:hypothetical protein
MHFNAARPLSASPPRKPAGFFTLASTLRCAHMIALGDIELARAMFVAAWICGTVTILAFWPRGNL